MVFSIGTTIFYLRRWYLFIFKYKHEPKYDSHTWVDQDDNYSVSLATSTHPTLGSVHISWEPYKIEEAKKYIKEMLCK